MPFFFLFLSVSFYKLNKMHKNSILPKNKDMEYNVILKAIKYRDEIVEGEKWKKRDI